MWQWKPNESIRTTMLLRHYGTFWDILGQFGTIRKTFRRVWGIQTIFLVLSDDFLPYSTHKKNVFWTNGRTDGPTNRRTDRRTDRRIDGPLYRDARTHLKSAGYRSLPPVGNMVKRMNDLLKKL